MEKIKEWVMGVIVKKIIAGWLGKWLANASGWRTYIGAALLALLAVVKYVLPLFIPVPAPVMEVVDSLILVVSGSTMTFASIKAQKVWEAIKKAGDEIVK